MLDDALSETRSAVQEPTSSSVLEPKKKRKRGLDGSVKDKKRKHESLESAVGSQTIVTNDPQNEKNQNAKKVPPDQHEETTFADDLLFAQMVPPIDLPLSGHADVSQSFLSQPQYMAPPFASSHAPRPEEVFPSQFHDSSPFGQQYQEGFPPLAEALPDFAYGTNEDILRVIQGLDLSKITNVLKTLEGAAAASDPSLSGVPLPDQAQSSQAYQAPSSSENILDQPNTEPTRQKGKRPLPAVFPTSSFEVNEEHAQLLAKKWLSTTKLAELVKTQGMSDLRWNLERIY